MGATTEKHRHDVLYLLVENKDKRKRGERGHCPHCHSEVYKRAGKKALNGLNQPTGDKPVQNFSTGHRS